jgi:hypothetical protein
MAKTSRAIDPSSPKSNKEALRKLNDISEV